MNSLESLKKLKAITPERYYTDRSRSAILATERPRRVSVWRIIFESLEAGSAIVLVGIFLILILGGFSGLKVLNISNLNTTSLKAEAEAIDMQIRLTSLSYKDFARIIAERKETAAPADAVRPKTDAAGTSGATTTPRVGIEDALKALSE